MAAVLQAFSTVVAGVLVAAAVDVAGDGGFPGDRGDRLATVATVLAGAVALAGVAMVARHRRRRLREERRTFVPSAEVEWYQHDHMPWAYWLALVLLVGSAAAVLAGGPGAVLGAGARGVLAGALWAALLRTLVSEYGHDRAYAVGIEGDHLVWVAPRRTRRVAIDRVLRVRVAVSRWPFGEHEAVFDTWEGPLRVVVPDWGHLVRLAELCATLERRSKLFDGRALRLQPAADGCPGG